MIDCIFRKAKKSDIELLIYLSSQLLDNTVSNTGNGFLGKVYDPKKLRFTYVLANSEEVVGGCVLRPFLQSEISAYSKCCPLGGILKGDTLYITTFFIQPKYQKMGYGSFLLDNIKRISKGARLCVDVAESPVRNTASQMFFAKNGFHIKCSYIDTVNKQWLNKTWLFMYYDN